MDTFVYIYDSETGEFIQKRKCRHEPVRNRPLVPANATLHEPPALGANERAVFDKESDKWNKVPDYRGVTYYQPDGIEVQLPLGESPAAELSETLPAAVVLNRAKLAKSDEVRAAFYVDNAKPVDVNGVQYHGGFESAMKLDGAKRLAELAGAADVTFTDLNNEAHTLTLAEAEQVIIAVGVDYQAKFMKKQVRMVTIENAASQSAVNSINY